MSIETSGYGARGPQDPTPVDVAVDTSGQRAALLTDANGALIISGTTSEGGSVTIDLTELIQTVRDTQGLTTAQRNDLIAAIAAVQTAMVAATSATGQVKTSVDSVKSAVDLVKASTDAVKTATTDGSASVKAAVDLVRAAVAAIPVFNGAISNWPTAYPAPATVTAIQQVRDALAGTLKVQVTNPLTGFATEATIGSILALLTAHLPTLTQDGSLPVRITGSDIALGGGGGEGGTSFDGVIRGIANGVTLPVSLQLPSSYPLPDAQVADLAHRIDTALRATPVPVTLPADLEVTLADGSTVALAAGTTIRIDPTQSVHVAVDGAVTLAAGTKVALADGTTVAVTVATLPLPAGAATAALQQSILDRLNSTDLVPQKNGLTKTDLTSAGLALDATGTQAVTLLQQIQALLGATGGLIVNGSSHPQPISAVSLPLPDGAAKDATVAAVVAALGGTIKVDAGTTATLPLPTGAATQTTLAAIQALLAGTLTVGLPAGAARDTTVSAITTALQAGITVSGPLTAAQLHSEGLATQATAASILAALQGTLAVGLPPGAAKDTTVAGITTALQAGIAVTGPLTGTQLSSAGLASQTTLAQVLAALVQNGGLPVATTARAQKFLAADGSTLTDVSATNPLPVAFSSAAASPSPHLVASSTADLTSTSTVNSAIIDVSQSDNVSFSVASNLNVAVQGSIDGVNFFWLRFHNATSQLGTATIQSTFLGYTTALVGGLVYSADVSSLTSIRFVKQQPTATFTVSYVLKQGWGPKAVGIFTADSTGLPVTLQGTPSVYATMLGTTIVQYTDSSASLAAGATFSGVARQTSGYRRYSTIINTDQSGTRTTMHGSTTTLTSHLPVSMPVAVASDVTAGADVVDFFTQDAYMSTKFVNGSTAQTRFQMITRLSAV